MHTLTGELRMLNLPAVSQLCVQDIMPMFPCAPIRALRVEVRLEEVEVPVVVQAPPPPPRLILCDLFIRVPATPSIRCICCHENVPQPDLLVHLNDHIQQANLREVPVTVKFHDSPVLSAFANEVDNRRARQDPAHTLESAPRRDIQFYNDRQRQNKARHFAGLIAISANYPNKAIGVPYTTALATSQLTGHFDEGMIETYADQMLILKEAIGQDGHRGVNSCHCDVDYREDLDIWIEHLVDAHPMSLILCESCGSYFTPQAYLNHKRGGRCEPRQITIRAGPQQGLVEFAFDRSDYRDGCQCPNKHHRHDPATQFSHIRRTHGHNRNRPDQRVAFLFCTFCGERKESSHWLSHVRECKTRIGHFAQAPETYVVPAIRCKSCGSVFDAGDAPIGRQPPGCCIAQDLERNATIAYIPTDGIIDNWTKVSQARHRFGHPTICCCNAFFGPSAEWHQDGHKVNLDDHITLIRPDRGFNQHDVDMLDV